MRLQNVPDAISAAEQELKVSQPALHPPPAKKRIVEETEEGDATSTSRLSPDSQVASDQELGFNNLMSPPSPTPSGQSDQSAASDPSPTTMDLQTPDSPCRLKLTRREGEWEVVQPQNFPPLPDYIPPLKLSRRNRRWAIDGRAS